MSKIDHRVKVAIVKCDSYKREKVQEAVAEAVKLLGGIELLGVPKDREVLLKPNLLAKADPEKAVTTHPEVFGAVAKILQDNGYTNVKYGDSPGNPLISLEKLTEGCGYTDVAKEYGVELGDFEHGREVDFPDGRVAKKFVLCEEVAKVCLDEETEGCIINICKMKTHQLERITGAMKNTFGCVYGVNKSASHAKYPNAEVFAKMTADLNQIVTPRLHIMDGIVAMEGNGPASGDPVKMNVIMASTDPVALDTAFCNLIGLDQKLVATNIAGVEAGVGTINEDIIDVYVSGLPMVPDGSLTNLDNMYELIGNRDFAVERGKDFKGHFKGFKLLFQFLDKKPVVLRDKCLGCGICVEACPVEEKAIFVIDKKATYEYSRCIKCYCCQEMCPEKAIVVKRSLIARIADRAWKI